MAQVEYDASAGIGAITYHDEKAIDEASEKTLHIQFQHGPVGENGVNGVQNEDVLGLLVMRLRALNARVPCRENSIAITKIEEAIHWLEHRTAARVAQGVEGTHENHTDA